MAVVSIATLKTYFETGDFPTENQFVDLIDTLSDIESNTGYIGWIDYTATSTVVGFADFSVEKDIRYLKIGKLLIVNFALGGTSNSTLASFTIPYTTITLTTNASFGQISPGVDNGIAAPNCMTGNFGNSNIVLMYPTDP